MHNAQCRAVLRWAGLGCAVFAQLRPHHRFFQPTAAALLGGLCPFTPTLPCCPCFSCLQAARALCSNWPAAYQGMRAELVQAQARLLARLSWRVHLTLETGQQGRPV